MESYNTASGKQTDTGDSGRLISLITSAKEITFSSPFAHLLISRTAQKLLVWLSQNSVEGWYMGHGRNH